MSFQQSGPTLNPGVQRLFRPEPTAGGDVRQRPGENNLRVICHLRGLLSDTGSQFPINMVETERNLQSVKTSWRGM